MQRRVIVLLTCIAALLFATLGYAERDTSQDAFLIEKGLKLATRMQRIAGDEHFVQFYSSDVEIQETVGKMSEFDPCKVSSVVLVSVDPERLLEMMLLVENDATAGLDALREETRDRLLRGMTGTLNTLFTAQFEGTAALAAASILSTGEAYVAPDASVYNQWLIFCYDSAAYDCAVAFTQSGDGIVSANAMFITKYAQIAKDGRFLLLGSAAQMTQMTGEEALALIGE